MKTTTIRIALAGLLFFMITSPSRAEEGGTGHYVPGSLATLIDLAPTASGWVIAPFYLHFGGEVRGSRRLPIGGFVASGVDATIDAFALGTIYTFDPQVLGAHLSVGAYVPYVRMDVTATVLSAGGSRFRSDSVDGLGDITLIPAMLAWKSGPWQLSALFSVYAPTGDYQVGRLANQGLNYWTLDPVFGVAYSDPTTGRNFSVNTGVTLNTSNEITDYDSGSVLHVDGSFQQLLPLGSGFLGVGANGFFYEQITADTGSGATLGDFEGRSVGIGPVLSYILPTAKGTWALEARWLPEIDTTNRVEGDYFWVKVAWQF